MRVRVAIEDDAPAILALTERLADFPLPPGRTAREIAMADHPILQEQLQNPRDDVLFLVAEDDGVVLGTAFANTRRDYFTQVELAYVEVLAVAERVAGKGIGRALMEAVEEWARRRGYRRIELSVFVPNTRARGLYEHLGYREEILRCIKQI